jgi:hypothetical protein
MLRNARERIAGTQPVFPIEQRPGHGVFRVDVPV